MSSERRQHPRLEEQIPLRISPNGGEDFVTHSVNISRSGLYCQVENYVEPMTKLKINLLIPCKRGDKNQNKKVSCEGVVVRTAPDEAADDRFNLAVFFNDISQRDAKVVADYVNSRLE